jgi:hypothetical protein
VVAQGGGALIVLGIVLFWLADEQDGSGFAWFDWMAIALMLVSRLLGLVGFALAGVGLLWGGAKRDVRICWGAWAVASGGVVWLAGLAASWLWQNPAAGLGRDFRFSFVCAVVATTFSIALFGLVALGFAKPGLRRDGCLVRGRYLGAAAACLALEHVAELLGRTGGRLAWVAASPSSTVSTVAGVLSVVAAATAAYVFWDSSRASSSPWAVDRRLRDGRLFVAGATLAAGSFIQVVVGILGSHHDSWTRIEMLPSTLYSLAPEVAMFIAAALATMAVRMRRPGRGVAACEE